MSSQSNGTKTPLSGHASTTSSQATLSLAIGGIYNDEISTNGNSIVSDFFSIGQSQNSFYSDNDTVILVSNLNICFSL